jgi:hypothetical protein
MMIPGMLQSREHRWIGFDGIRQFIQDQDIFLSAD